MKAVTFLFSSLALYAGSGIHVDVCVDNRGANAVTIDSAKQIASRILRQANVELVWHWSRKCPTHAIEIELLKEAPSGYPQRALAYAKPFEGHTIQVFLDRVRNIADQRIPVRLGFVLAHEITHVLQVSDSHTRDGIMKARWEPEDLRGMLNWQLRLTPRDVELIHLGLALRQDRISMESRILLTAEAK